MKLCATVFLALTATAASAKDVAMIDPLEFMVAWPDLVGKDVVVTKGRIAAASDALMILQIPGGNVVLRPPWKDRDDLRFLFANCTSVLTDDKCDVAASGTVETAGGKPALVGVDFFKPAGH